MRYTYKDIIEAIKNDTLYDYISSKRLVLDATDLRDLILELYYILRVEENNEGINEKLIEHLKNNRDWE